MDAEVDVTAFPADAGAFAAPWLAASTLEIAGADANVLDGEVAEAESPAGAVARDRELKGEERGGDVNEADDVEVGEAIDAEGENLVLGTVLFERTCDPLRE